MTWTSSTVISLLLPSHCQGWRGKTGGWRRCRKCGDASSRCLNCLPVTLYFLLSLVLPSFPSTLFLHCDLVILISTSFSVVLELGNSSGGTSSGKPFGQVKQGTKLVEKKLYINLANEVNWSKWSEICSTGNTVATIRPFEGLEVTLWLILLILPFVLSWIVSCYGFLRFFEFFSFCQMHSL